jgi:CBS domain-containing protein
MFAPHSIGVIQEESTMTVGAFCSRIVVFVGQDDSVVDAAKLMRKHHTGSVVVVEDARCGAVRPVGMITDRDLVVEVLAEEVEVDSVSIKDVMTSDPVVVRENDGLSDTLKRMRARGVRRVPVVDSEENIVGVLSIDDVISLLASELEDIDSLILREQEHEREVRVQPSQA